ncbi:MAG: FAD-dependent oxidoreductase [Candidatus Promineifilaceae bacterium]
MNETHPTQITMYGAHWCPDCRRAKQFFGEHRIDYVYVDIEQHPETIEFIKAQNNGMRIIPTILFPDGTKLAEPSNADLAATLNITTRAERSFYDVIIVGAGPTGLTAATYLGREGADVLVLDKAGVGGQAGITQVLDNFPGFDEGIAGAEFADRLARQATRFGAEIVNAQAVTRLNRDGQYWCVSTSDGQTYGANAILLATGAQYRRLGAKGESELIGINIHFCATCDGAFYRDKKVLVIGGGNSGFEEGLFLTKFASQVDIVEFNETPKASVVLQDKVAEQSNMSVITNHAVKEFVGDGQLDAIKVQNRATGEIVSWDYDGAFVFIGLSPNAELVKEQVDLDGGGFVVTDKTLMSSIPGIFAAGDVRSGSTKQAASAAGEGATAALMIRQYLSEITA